MKVIFRTLDGLEVLSEQPYKNPPAKIYRTLYTPSELADFSGQPSKPEDVAVRRYDLFKHLTEGLYLYVEASKK